MWYIGNDRLYAMIGTLFIDIKKYEPTLLSFLIS